MEYGKAVEDFVRVTELSLWFFDSEYLELMNFKCLIWNENMFAARLYGALGTEEIDIHVD